MRVFVYFNLHKQRLSVKALQGEHYGRVVAHVDAITLRDAEFRVSQAGRERVLREGRKNVHAGVVGEWQMDALTPAQPEGEAITYNPHRFATFVKRADLSPVHTAQLVHIVGRNVRAEVCA